jgi:protein SCO1
MDPEVKSNKPGTCPKCGMTLRLFKEEAPSDSNANKNANENSDTYAIKDYSRPGAIPDTPIYDQDGQKLHFYSDLVKGKTVAINFIFTTCTTICPVMTATFAQMRRELGAEADRIRFVSITIDPEHDTPSALAEYAERFGAPQGWSFLTGSPADVERVLRALDAWVVSKTSHRAITLLRRSGDTGWVRLEGLGSGAALADEARLLLD